MTCEMLNRMESLPDLWVYANVAISYLDIKVRLGLDLGLSSNRLQLFQNR